MRRAPGKYNDRSGVDLTWSQSDDPARPSTKATPHPHPLGMLLPYARATSHPDFHRRSWSFTRSTDRWLRPGRGLSPPVRNHTDPGARAPSMHPPVQPAHLSAGTLIRTVPGLVHTFWVGRWQCRGMRRRHVGDAVRRRRTIEATMLRLRGIRTVVSGRDPETRRKVAAASRGTDQAEGTTMTPSRCREPASSLCATGVRDGQPAECASRSCCRLEADLGRRTGHPREVVDDAEQTTRMPFCDQP